MRNATRGEIRVDPDQFAGENWKYFEEYKSDKENIVGLEDFVKSFGIFRLEPRAITDIFSKATSMDSAPSIKCCLLVISLRRLPTSVLIPNNAYSSRDINSLFFKNPNKYELFLLVNWLLERFSPIYESPCFYLQLFAVMNIKSVYLKYK